MVRADDDERAQTVNGSKHGRLGMLNNPALMTYRRAARGRQPACGWAFDPPQGAASFLMQQGDGGDAALRRARTGLGSTTSASFDRPRKRWSENLKKADPEEKLSGRWTID